MGRFASEEMLEMQVPSQAAQQSKAYRLNIAPSTAGGLPERKEEISEFISFGK